MVGPNSTEATSSRPAEPWIDLKEFRCPRCLGTLAPKGTDVACRPCASTYLVRDGIVDFRIGGADYYFNPVPQAAMRAITDAMDRDGWLAAVNRFLAHVQYRADWIDNLTSDSRYAWKILLDLKRGATLLDLGCGLGSLTHNLAPHVGRVYALDLTWERIRFAAQRFRASNPGDDIVPLAGGDAPHLPFPDGAVDIVVLSGVLEWVGEGDLTRFDSGSKIRRAWRMAWSCLGRNSPRAIQAEFLRDIRRVLKADGQLFIAIENRLNYQYMIGRPDHHSRLMFGSLLPRPLANLYSIAVARRPYRTYTYSIPGYKSLLRKAGFSDVEFFALSPGYTRLAEVFPAQVDDSRWRPQPRRNLRDRVRRNKYLVPAYGMVASARHGRSHRLRDRMCAEIEATCSQSVSDTVIIEDYLVGETSKAVLIARVGVSPIVIRLPFSRAEIEAERRNAEALQHGKAGFAAALSYVPRPLAQGVIDGLSYFVEERISGRPLYEDSKRIVAGTYLKEVARVLHDLNPILGAASPFEGQAYQRDVVERLDRLFRVGVDERLGRGLPAYLREHLHGLPLPRGIRHGDMSTANLLASRDGVITGLIDWETSQRDGLPILDAIGAAASMRRRRAPSGVATSIVPLGPLEEWGNAAEQEFLAAEYKRNGIDLSHHKALAHLFWLHDVSERLVTGLCYRRPQLDRHVDEVLREGLGRSRALREM